jgi:hypothetical protein
VGDFLFISWVSHHGLASFHHWEGSSAYDFVFSFSGCNLFHIFFLVHIFSVHIIIIVILAQEELLYIFLYSGKGSIAGGRRRRRRKRGGRGTQEHRNTVLLITFFFGKESGGTWHSTNITSYRKKFFFSPNIHATSTLSAVICGRKKKMSCD